MKKIKLILALLPVILLAGCCYDEKGNLISYEDCPASPAINATFQCNGASCGSSLTAYNGTDSNIWSYKNSGATFNTLSVSITNIPNKEITIVYTNEGTGYVNLPSIPIDTALRNEIYPYGEEYEKEYDEEFYEFKEPDFMRDDPPELIESDDISPSQMLPLKAWSVGNPRDWKINEKYGATSRPSTLKKQLTVNGRTINIWVENSEYANGNINDAKINFIASNVGTIYANVVKVAGEPWGPHKYSNLIPSNQPLDIVFFNSGGRIGGYFWSRNNYTGYSSTSNQAVVIFIDTRMSDRYTLSTIAHELTHVINFYQRRILMGDGHQYDSFLDEMPAVMMEDAIAGKISYNAASSRYAGWLNALLYNCELKWGACSDNYAVSSSFGAFLLRQYGINFFKTMLQMRSNLSINDSHARSIDLLDRSIKVYDNGGLAKALRNWGASIAMLPAATAPKGFGYPARNNDNGFNLEAFDGNSYRSYRKLLTASPATLAPTAHFPFLRKTTSNIYNESFVVPKGVGVSIVVK
jgi:outer membrane murein-binding lipoprotein Lpp